MKFKFKKRIFTKLIICFVSLPILLIITALLCLLLDLVTFTQGNMQNLFPYNVVDENGKLQNLDIVQEIGGWLEELDAEYRVVQVYGEKKNNADQYTQDEIFSLLSFSPDSDNAFVGFLMDAPADGYYLCLYERDIFQVNIVLDLNNASSTPSSRLTRLFLVIFFLLAGLEVLFMSLYLRRKIKKPLEHLAEGMERIKAGESGVFLDIKTEAEFEQIVDAFNLMTNELEKQKQENAGLIAQKNQMLLELSHDIKTPIATIKSYANALEAGLVSDEKKPDYYRTIDLKAGRVAALSEDMFFMLKMDNPDYAPTFETVNICEFLRKICAEYYDEITGAGFTFSIDIPEDDIPTNIDVSLFSRVVINLLSNALRYNKSGKYIGIFCRKDSAHVTVEVTDDGAPIDEALASQMFTAFVRGDRTRKTDGGTGLGLAISKVIVEKHGGEIGYKRTEGKNNFFICLSL